MVPRRKQKAYQRDTGQEIWEVLKLYDSGHLGWAFKGAIRFGHSKERKTGNSWRDTGSGESSPCLSEVLEGQDSGRY